jgi:UDP-N-acetylmuramate dehydrogenase
VIHTGSLLGIETDGEALTAGAGEAISDVSRAAADDELDGLAFIYAMPGTTGGAVWMNARCYDGEIAPILESVSYVALDGPDAGHFGVYEPRPDDFGYKVSPFQDGRRVISAVTFSLRRRPGYRDILREQMRDHERDRRAKGHFDAPCAGSMFKNDRSFGSPSGAIIDRCGLRGFQIGGARISDRHGNIFINTGSASARDIRALMTETRERVYRETGFLLQPEVLFVGAWE